MIEFKLQSQCFLHHWNKYPEERGLLFTVNNNASDSYQGAVMKAMGVVAGVSDMVYLHPSGAMLLEFKTLKGRQNDRQVWWQGQVEKAGYRYIIIRSFDDFTALLDR
jgi:hypothetical protein